MMERLLGKKVLYYFRVQKTMLKILVIDRCHFTRTGMEAWLNHTDVLSSSLLVSGMNNLILAKEHILQWKPHLVIADLYGFLNDALPEQPINAFFVRLQDDAVSIITVREYAVQIAICQPCGVI